MLLQSFLKFNILILSTLNNNKNLNSILSFFNLVFINNNRNFDK